MPYNQDIRCPGDYNFNVCVFYNYLSDMGKKIVDTDNNNSDISTYDNEDFERELEYYVSIYVNWKIFGNQPRFITDTGSKMTPDDFHNPMDFVLEQMTTRYMKTNKNFVLADIDDPAYEEVEEKKEDEQKTCCMCAEEIVGYGNNPRPLKDDGECCNSCNTYVVAYRICCLTAEEKLTDESTKLAFLQDKKAEFLVQALKT